MQVETDEPELIERVAALDVGKAEVVCCVRSVVPPRSWRTSYAASRLRAAVS